MKVIGIGRPYSCLFCVTDCLTLHVADAEGGRGPGPAWDLCCSTR